MSELSLRDFRHGGVNITGFNLINHDSTTSSAHPTDASLTVRYTLLLYPVYMMKQKHEANLEHTSCTRVLNAFASRLLYVCFLV